ncbi:RHS repeat-associated core domain-containing protein [Frankia gtarii]|uniref:RHS repeat-associated core domain-containing protein n=1 Tax=Frankia gtarii TaxID=2950102 RepID=UPI0021BEB8C5|nr:RHS repeat-associated core domain-containing protein [Frankia gtarii]
MLRWSGGAAVYAESTEFGSPYFPSSAYPRYGWLGAKQRSRDTLSGLTLMGVRLYDPNLGRFLQTDPEPGGSDNAYAYDYAHQDPYNTFDLDGQFFRKIRKGWKGIQKQVKKHGRVIATVAVITAGGFAAATCVTGVGCFIVAGAVTWNAQYVVSTPNPSKREMYKQAGYGAAAGVGGVEAIRGRKLLPRIAKLPPGRHRR